MAKLYFKYGAMGSSKSAQALMTKFNYEEKDRKVWLIKPSIDTRDGSDTVYSRIGLSAKAQVISPQDDIYEMFGEKCRDADVVISDESQFFTEDQIDQLRRIVDECDIPVLCFGLRTDFLTHVFPKPHTVRGRGFHNRDKDHLPLRQKGDRQRENRRGRTGCDQRLAGAPRRQ